MARSNKGVIGTNMTPKGNYPTPNWQQSPGRQMQPQMSAMQTPSWAQGIKTPTQLPSYKKGGMVKKTGPALMHKGEMVIPKKHANALAKLLSKNKS